MQQLLAWLSEHWVASLVGLSCIVEIAPIKVNPWKSLLKWIGGVVNKPLTERIDKIDANIKQIEIAQTAQQKTIDENEIDRIRFEVLDFANSCRNKRLHTKDEFDHIIAMNDKYEKLLEKYDLKNGVFDAEYKYILDLYAKCQRENDFL